MKKIILIMILTSFVLSAKNIKDYFLMLPDLKDSANGHDKKILSKKERKSILKKNSKNYQNVVIDVKNGFMEYTTNTDVEGYTVQITYYNLKNKKKLIIVNDIEWGMSNTSSRYSLYYINGKHIKKIKSSEVFPNWDIRDFIVDKNKKKKKEIYNLLKKRAVVFFYLLDLPKKGKNISLSVDWWSSFYDIESSSDPIDKNLYKDFSSLKTRDSIILKYRNGKFYK